MEYIGLYLMLSFLPNGFVGARIMEDAFSTKTAYRHCNLHPFRDGKLDQLNRCTLIHTTGLFRHGTRTPSKKQSKAFLELFNKLKSSASNGAKLPNGFLTHPVPFQDNEPERHLIEAGYVEHEGLGQWIREMSLHQGYSYSLKNTKFYSSSSDRAIESGRAFYNGLLNYSSWFTLRTKCTESPADPMCSIPGYDNYAQYADKLKQNIHIDDQLLRFYDYCPRYKQEVKDDKTATSERDKFKESDAIKKVLKEFTKRFKLGSGYKTDDLGTIFLACAFELAANYKSNAQPPWCEFMSTSFNVALEYLDDMKQYWTKSYPYSVSYEQACPTLNFIIEGLKKAADDFKKSRGDFNRGRFMFGHAETLFPIVTLLGLFNETIGSNTLVTLSADAGFERRQKLIVDPDPPANTFRSSYVSPFAGNIVFKLYHCPNEDNSTEFYVQPLVNGKTVAWPAAGDVQPPTPSSLGGTVASLQRMVEKYQPCSSVEYSHKAICTIHGSAAESVLFQLKDYSLAWCIIVTLYTYLI